ncbi:thymidylate synthase [Aliterella atlantica]|uniref:Thymidylate synthase n=1 Tax=Aliterella atlantica CENA595 TaxID=1618023 RepID=A0A0D8ZS98_9CYAN|nr:thymidylate synthase [Aliterella atlantica]KJH71197.1 thymidylate synthase [Aliterella atlantica CENA595]
MTNLVSQELYYRPAYKPNQVICGSGQTVVVTGWTVKESVAKHLQPYEYAGIGACYSPTRGISLLIRNLLANPVVRYLVVLNATKEDRNAGACTCLLDFFGNGFELGITDTGKQCWVIRSAVVGYIDIEIAADDLEQLRASVECFEAKTIAEAASQVKQLAKRERVEPWGEPKTYPLATVEPTVLPGTRYGHRIEGKTIAETWVKIVHRIKTTGTIRPTGYDGQWQELIDLMAIVTDEPEGFYFPEPNYLPCDRTFISEYVSQILDDAPTVEGVKYTYGQRLRSHFGLDQVEQAIGKLIADIDSARVVMSLWDVQDGEANSSPPCLNHIWLRVIDNELSLTATFRSNDMFSAWVANAMGLRALQQHIRDEICDRSKYNLQMGPLITISQSAHIYDDCWENADNLIANQYKKAFQERDYADPSGSFVINIQDSEIVVEHMTPGTGEVVNCYSGKSATQLCRQIAADCPALQVGHAMYLGCELQKAELALLNQHYYTQDRPLKIKL